MQTGCHAVSLKISSCPSGTIDSFRPGRRFASRFCLVENDIEVPATQIARNRTVTAVGVPGFSPTEDRAYIRTTEANHESQSELDLAEKAALNGMLISQPQDSTLIPTQVFASNISQCSNDQEKRPSVDLPAPESKIKRQKRDRRTEGCIRDMEH